MGYGYNNQKCDFEEVNKYIGLMRSYGIKTVVGMNKYLTENKMWDNFEKIKTMNTFESGFKAVGISIVAYKETMKLLGNENQSYARLEKQEYVR